MCNGRQSQLFGLFRIQDVPNPRIYEFEPCSATWSMTSPSFELRDDIIQIVLIPGRIVALTDSGCVVVRKTDNNHTDFFTVANGCIKLLQAGRHCFGLFREPTREISLKRYDIYLNVMEYLSIRMTDHFASCTRATDVNDNVTLYIAGENFELGPCDLALNSTSVNSSDEHNRSTLFGPNLLCVRINPLGVVYALECHDIFVGSGCMLNVEGDVLSLWMKGFREVVKFNPVTLEIEWVEFVAQGHPLANQLLASTEATLHSVGSETFLFYRRLRNKSPGSDTTSYDLNTYELRLNDLNDRRCWTHVASFMRAELLSVFDGTFAVQCQRL